VRHRISRLLVAGFVLSLFFHFVVGPLLVWLFGYRMPPAKPEVLYVVQSSSITHAPRPHPRPPVQRPPVPQPQHVAVPQPHQQQQQKPQPPRPEVKREIARIDRRSVHPPPAHAVALSAATQQQMFEKTIARLRAENNPLVSAARSTVAPAAPRRFNFDFSGSVGTAPTAEGILTPDRSWRDNGYDYYYVRYWVQYADGSTETGIVPWPLRYRPSDDPFRLGMEHFPLPGPMADYVLPPGTNLHPLVAFCYKHRDQFPNCPIQHD
jgi:hypothetical protein